MRIWVFGIAVVSSVVTGACGGSDPSATEPLTSSTTPPTTAAASGVDTASPTTVLIEVDPGSLGTDHVEPPVEFSQSPSIGGDHYPFWQNCGFYDVPVLEGAATHTLEHGAVWITYNRALLDAAGLDELESLAAANPKLLISPYEHSEPLVLSAWGAQLRTSDGPESPDVALFIERWVDNPALAEAGVTCAGAAGIPPSDVRTLADGTVVPDSWT